MPEERERPPFPLLVVTALKEEAVTFCHGAGPSFVPISLCHFNDFLSDRASKIKDKVLVLYTGPGPYGQKALDALFSREKVRRVLFCGFAGGLAPFIDSGEVVVGLQIFKTGGPPLPLDPPEFLFSRYRTGSILSVDRMVSSQEEKKILRSRTGGDVVDMESAQWVALSNVHNLAAWVVRVVSDSAVDLLPRECMSFVDEKGETSIGGLLKGLVARPSLLFSLLRMSGGLIRAHSRLRELGRVVAAHLGSSEKREESF